LYTQSVKIDHNQVLNIVVWDLIDKYKNNFDRNNVDWVIAFEKVLRYYLDENEMTILRNAIHNNQLPQNPLDLFGIDRERE